MNKVDLNIEKQIINLYKEGYGTSMMARKLNLGKRNVRKYLKDN